MDRVRAERRQITVLFCDLVDSIRISEGLDPEDLADLISAYRDACDRAIKPFDGFVARYVGDGILIYFGYPTAHEDAAERGVRAALDIVRLVSRVEIFGVSLKVRIGIATGLVFAGDVVGQSSSESHAILGETPNLAARLQDAGAPNSVIVSSSTHRLLAGRFVCEELGSLQLKGFAQTTKAFRIVGEGEASSRFEAVAGKGLTPLVGRSNELNLLVKCWQSAVGGRSQVVLISGEAGIGKSRLISEFRKRLVDGVAFSIQLQCSPYHKNSSLHPAIDWLQRGLQLGQMDDSGDKLNKLEAVLDDLGLDTDSHLAYLASLLSIPMNASAAGLAIEPELIKLRTSDTLLTMIEREAQRRQVLIVVEDLHWCDPSTLELLGLLIERLRGTSAVIIATFRPEFVPPWQTDYDIMNVELSRLDSNESKDLITSLNGERKLNEGVIKEVLVRCDGVPLFAEELFKAIADADGNECTQDDHGAKLRSQRYSIPSSLQDSLIAQLDKLPSGKQVAQVAALLGRSFNYELLAAIWTEDEVVLRQALSDLVQARILYTRGAPSTKTYEFRHILLQDAARNLLLRRTRVRLHKLIAEVLEKRFPAIATSQPEILAYHWTEARRADNAVPYWLSAGQRASERSAMLEAVAHFKSGLALVHEISTAQKRKQLEIEIQIPLSASLMATEGPGSTEVEAAYARAVELCADMPQTPLYFAAAWGSWRIAMDFRTGRRRADKLLNLARNIGDAGLIMQAHHCQWATLFQLGEQQACCEHIEEGLKLYDPEAHFSHSGVYGGHDAKVCALGEASLSYFLRGYPERAVKCGEAALTWASQLNHAGSMAHALDYAAMFARYLRDADSVFGCAQEMISFAEEQDLVDYRAKGRLFHGYARALFGEVEQGLREMQDAMEAELRIGTDEDFPVYYEMLAEVSALAGKYDEGLEMIRQVAPIVEGKGLCYWAAELHRRRGEIMLAQAEGSSAKSEAEEQLQHAITVARTQDAKVLEIRALCSLVRHQWKSDQPDSPYQALRRLVSEFPQKCEVLDLREARALLAKL